MENSSNFGDVSGIWGTVETGNIQGLEGNSYSLSGDVSGICGTVETGNDVSGMHLVFVQL